MRDAASEQAMAQEHRVIIGDGVTAAAFVETAQLKAGDHLTVIGPNADGLGRGIAYAAETEETPWRYAYLLNSPADDIDPDFGGWLEDRWDALRDMMQGRSPNWVAAAQPLVDRGDIRGLNVPRAVYGDFLEERATSALEVHRANGVTVQFINAAADRLEQTSDGFSVHAGEQIVHATSVDVATGGPATQRIPGDDGPYSAPTLFGQEPRIAEHIRRGAEIWCIGTNATMLDTLRLCQSLIPEDQIRFVGCSPRGALPEPLVPQMPRRITLPQLAGPYETAEAFLEDVRQNIERAQATGDKMIELRAGFRSYFIEHGLKWFLPDMDEARKVPKTLRHWFRSGTRDTLEDFARLSLSGHTRIHRGAVQRIETEGDHAVVVTTNSKGQEERHAAGFVVNCSGSAMAFDPFTEDLLTKGWISRSTESGGIVVGSGCKASVPGLRYLSPATTEIGDEVMPMPLYDANLLRVWARRANES
ncbi:FAD/NAD(P)-binding protein [Shimia ponticola]|uniref:FAD/NAD(P)-binding protein n=1 Tax=Shimia ponticola TaxID=2582893 RepID=UPI0011BE9428|nr:FAD/NAD(P)-binding protein [Shimia ponticola]